MSKTMTMLAALTKFQEIGADIQRRRQLLEVEAQTLDQTVQEWMKENELLDQEQGQVHLIDVIKKTLEKSSEPKLILS